MARLQIELREKENISCITLVPDEEEGPEDPIACWLKPCLWISLCNSGAYRCNIHDQVYQDSNKLVVQQTNMKLI